MSKETLKGQAEPEGQELIEEPEDLEEPINNDNALLPTLHMRIKGIAGLSLEISASGFDMNQAASLFDHALSKYKDLTKEENPKGEKKKKGTNYIG